MEIVTLIIGSYLLLVLLSGLIGWLCYRFGLAHGRLHEITRHEGVAVVDLDVDPAKPGEG